MTDRIPDNQDIPAEAPQAEPAQDAGIDARRRRLTGSALGAAAVFTLASRPVWANQCTISGMASGNLSAPDKVTCEGCTPGYWGRCQHLGAWAAAGYSPADTFNSVFGVTEYVDCSGVPYTLLDVLYLQGGSYSCGLPLNPSGQDRNNGPAHPAGAPAGCTHGNAFKNMGGDPVSVNLGFHAVPALLNAGHPGVEFGYTPGEIINLFKSNYKTNPEALKNTLAMLNERGCPLGSDTPL